MAGLLPAVISCESIFSVALGISSHAEGIITGRNNEAERRSGRPQVNGRQHMDTLSDDTSALAMEMRPDRMGCRVVA
ncbi:hypothetical protein PtrM4_085400 [Pyrenophora tritici-repentis]|uniref:Uncharacterized protein n=1 Tax=Pyrenophora tritici-repentis TaxID=45151 RepID=A0A317AAY6_9PLEO|nr:hypothetical protein PtrM4_085400 [Pyrenophora tritici-repentis]